MAEGRLERRSASTPIVLFAHIPLWTVYPEWGWGTSDSEQALGYVKRFGSVTVLNGHIHQTMQKVEGKVTFHTAMSTAFPQPAPGSAPSPGPMKVPADKLRGVLGIREVEFGTAAATLAMRRFHSGVIHDREVFCVRCSPAARFSSLGAARNGEAKSCSRAGAAVASATDAEQRGATAPWRLWQQSGKRVRLSLIPNP